MNADNEERRDGLGQDQRDPVQGSGDPLACSGDVAGDHDDPLDERFEVEPDEKTLHADGFEGALIGYGQQFNRLLAVCDYAKCVEILIDRDGMSDDEAEEWMSFNVTGGWHGEYTPVFLILNRRM